jgi:hypothetical protein
MEGFGEEQDRDVFVRGFATVGVDGGWLLDDLRAVGDLCER